MAKKKSSKKTYTTDALTILDHRYKLDTPRRKASIDKERQNAEVAEQIYKLRTEANLSQAQLARRIGTTQSVISRLEDADYNGHSLPMLRRIASALSQRVEVRFVPDTGFAARLVESEIRMTQF